MDFHKMFDLMQNTYTRRKSAKTHFKTLCSHKTNRETMNDRNTRQIFSELSATLTHNNFQFGFSLGFIFQKTSSPLEKGFKMGTFIFGGLISLVCFRFGDRCNVTWVILESHPVKIMQPHYSWAKCPWMICNGMPCAGISPCRFAFDFNLKLIRCTSVPGQGPIHVPIYQQVRKPT